MTIVINLCWYDKLKRSYRRREQQIDKALKSIGLFAGIPAIITVIYMLTDSVVKHGTIREAMIPFPVLVLLTVYGAVASPIAIGTIIKYLKEKNTEKHWFEVKHCKDEDCK